MRELLSQVSGRIAASEADRGELICLFEDIASGLGWDYGDHLRAHAAHSTYFMAHVGSKLAGGIQLELPESKSKWSFQTVWPETRPTDDRVAAYVAMFGIAQEFRADPRTFWPPCIELWKFAVRTGISELWVVATPATLAVYRRLGWPLDARAEPRRHWGEICLLTSMPVSAIDHSIAKRARKSMLYQAIHSSMHGGGSFHDCLLAVTPRRCDDIGTLQAVTAT